MRHIITLFILILAFLSSKLHAQLSMGTDGLFIRSGTDVFMDSLTLTPNSDVTISNNNLHKSYLPEPGTPTGTIERVYSWSSPISISGVLGIYYAATELNGNNPALLQIVSSANLTSVMTSNSASTAYTNYVEANFNSGTIQRLSALESGSVLPLDWLSFQVVKINTRQALIKWATANERDNKHFMVERSSNGIDFSEINRIHASNQNMESQYSYIDEYPFKGKNFYRVQSVGYGGEIAYTPVRMLEFEDLGTDIVFYPNPAKQFVILEHLPSNALVLLYDMNGRMVHNQKTNEGRYHLSLVGLSTGIYQIQIVSENGVLTFGKLEVL
jgi:hypothetical protein